MDRCLIILNLFIFVYLVDADYSCLCSYNAEKEVFNTTIAASNHSLGYLYEADCKEQLNNIPATQGWVAVAFQHKIGFVQSDNKTNSSMCSGDSPDSDKVDLQMLSSIQVSTTSYIPHSTTFSATTETTTTSSTTTQISSTPNTVQSTTISLSPIITGNTDLCPVAIKSFTAHDGGIFTQYDKKCYEVVPHRVSWTYAERDCKGKGGNLVQIKSADEQSFIYKYLHDHYNHNVWIGLHDGNNEGHFEWDADPNSDQPVYTYWQPGESHNHQVDDCVYLRPQDGGHWHDGQCSGGFFYTPHAYICQYETDASAKLNGTINPHGDGNTHLCPSNVQRHASKFHGTLGQHEKSCYEVLPRYKVTWSHGEQLCKQEGGHLAHIRNAEEQKFIQEFMTNHLPDHAVWIGLNDRQHENTFVWSSGEPVTYTNWVGGHDGNFVSHYQEDCALFIPYQKGQWDDLPCGTHAFILGDIGETHPILCQFGASVGPAIVG